MVRLKPHSFCLSCVPLSFPGTVGQKDEQAQHLSCTSSTFCVAGLERGLGNLEAQGWTGGCTAVKTHLLKSKPFAPLSGTVTMLALSSGDLRRQRLVQVPLLCNTSEGLVPSYPLSRSLGLLPIPTPRDSSQIREELPAHHCPTRLALWCKLHFS